MSYYEGLPIYKSRMDTIALAVERPWCHGVLKRRELRYLIEPVGYNCSEPPGRRPNQGEPA